MESAVSRGISDRFEETVLPHLNAAYNLARWLTRNEQDAEDVVQESYLRALRSFDSFQFGRDARAWLLKIVRNTYYTSLQRNRPHEVVTQFEENTPEAISTDADPETALIEKVNTELIRGAIESISLEYREVFILRELEQLSYKEIAQIVDVPLGTVMSRLSRGRKELEMRLRESVGGSGK
jgi:RNA polymerase sigma-70 factor (ECF subfamily)